MRRSCHARLMCVLVLGLFIALAEPVRLASAKSQSTMNNRFNVVMVVDASWSMKKTDPSKLRFEAINQFVTLLAEKGNKLGGVVFRDHNIVQKELIAVNSSKEKDIITDTLAEKEPAGNTNIGEALDRAMDMLEKTGDKDLQSVILLLTDGNTDMPGATEEEKEASQDMKDNAVRRAFEDNIRIYSVCLNADRKANLDELRRISEGTHAQMIEVQRAEDLQGAFNEFYKFIFGSSTITIADKTFDDSGTIQESFNVPGLGVEEINIVLYGKEAHYELVRPAVGSETKGKPVTPIVKKASTFTLLKVTDIVPGRWSLITTGKPGDPIKINLLFNTNLQAQTELVPKKDAYHPDDEITIRTYLSQAGKRATSANMYAGYKAELHVYNALNYKLIDSIPMDLSEKCFELKKKFKDGTYLFSAQIKSDYLERSSDTVGPFTVSTSAKPENTPPEAVVNPLEATVNVWPAWSPIGDKDYKLDFNTLAVDRQDKKLDYAIIDTSFMVDDYTVENNQLTVTNFSMSKGEFIVRAADSQGATCDIRVILNSRDVGLIMLMLAIAGTIAATGVLVVGFIKAIQAFPRGTVSVHSNVNGSISGKDDIHWRGRLRLSRCELDPTGLDYGKSYIQATGKRYVYLQTDKPVMYGGRPTKQVRIDSGQPVFVDVEDSKRLEIRFASAIDPNSLGLGGRKRPRIPKVHDERRIRKRPRPQKKREKKIPKRIPKKQ